MNFSELSRNRFSVRRFSDRPVPREVLEDILEAGRVAPTAHNNQPWRVRVLQSPGALAKADDVTSCRYGAPVVLLFSYDEVLDWKNPLEAGVHAGVQDVSIVATHMMLAAWEKGVGSVWVNYFEPSKTEKEFGFSPTERAVLLLPLGYAAEGAAPAPAHTEKKALADLVEWL